MKIIVEYLTIWEMPCAKKNFDLVMIVVLPVLEVAEPETASEGVT
jgi:hypothetical protein